MEESIARPGRRIPRAPATASDGETSPSRARRGPEPNGPLSFSLDGTAAWMID